MQQTQIDLEQQLAAGARRAQQYWHIVAYLFITAPASLRWIPLIQGALIGAFMFILAYRLSLIRYYVLALLSTLLGVALLWIPWNDSLTTGTYYAGMGVLLMATGGGVLARYLRQRPPTEAQ
jgi:hypothetical protein